MGINQAAYLEPVEFDPFAGAPVERVVATSEAQREVWLADKLGQDASLAFNESVNLRLRGGLDIGALRSALQALVARHEALRSTVGPEGTELLIGDAAAGVDVPLHDLRAEDEAARIETLKRAAEQAVETPFDVSTGPLFRAALYSLADDEHVLMMTAHHIVCDGWSWGVLTDDLGALYAERLGLAPAPEAPARYGDYVAWELGEAFGPAMREHEAFWLRRFAGSSLPVLDLPTDRPRAPVRTFHSRRIDRMLDAELVADVRKLGAKAGVSSFAALFSAFAATLHRLTGHDDLVIGVPAAGQSASGMTALVGHCVNLLPVRVAVDPVQPFVDFASRSGGALLDAFEHQTLTYGTLLKKLPVQRDPSRLPLVSVMFNVDQAVTAGAGKFPGVNVDLSANPRHFENFELFVNVAPVAGWYRLECQYNTDLFDAVTIERWLGAYEALLRSAVRDGRQPVGKLGWISPAEIDALRALQPAATPLEAQPLMHGAFERQCAITPQRTALRCGDQALSYLELDQRSNRLARALRTRGVARGDRVGLCVGRGVDMLVSLLAVLKAGATYVPLDPGFPQARLAYYAEDARLAMLLTESSVTTAPRDWRDDAAQRILVLDRDLAWLNEPAEPLPSSEHDARPDDAAYIIYTSGSTGKPKGVCVPHRAVANFLASMRLEPGITADDKLAAVTTLSFDIAVLELLLPLGSGAEVVLVPRETAMDGNALRVLLESHGATMMQATPGMWRMLLDTDWRGSSGFKALVGGESCPPDLARALLERVGELWNMYGPTETTVWSTVWRVDLAQLAQRGMSIGRPIANTSVWILDEALQPCPVGVPGEICIGGTGVALGYLDREELTADRFKPDPFSGVPHARLYRTGDRGRWRNDGLLEHLGRFDFQVKVRGYRIELGEIEAACNEVDGVAHSVVMAREDHPGDVRLVAYLTLSPGASFDETALRAHLRSRLPEYMIPQHVLVLDAMPYLPNGKVDRKALPAPDVAREDGAAARVAPRNELERAVLVAMESVLNLPQLGIHDDFFALGGHSLLAARLTSRLNRDFEIVLPLRTLFESPTAEKLALAIVQARGGGAPKRDPIVHDPLRRSAPLTPMQERIRFVEELHPGRVVYNTPSAHRLTGPMDLPKFEAALREMVRRQPALRTRVAAAPNGKGYVQAIAESVDFTLPLEDLSAVPEAQREAELMRRMQAIVDTPIDIYNAPLFRVAMYRLAADHHAFLFMPHHIIWDGWSFDLLYAEMSAIYGALVEGRSVPLKPLAVDYGDFAQWHADWMRGDEYAAQMRYWKDRFAKAPLPKAPRPDNARRAGMSGEGASEWVRIDAGLTERLREIARGADATLNMLAMALYAALMASVVDGDSIVIGMPVRGRAQAELEPVMGFFNNLLPVQLVVPRERKVVDFVRDLKAELLEVFGHQEVPFERLAVEPEVAARTQRVGLYQALFSFQDARERTRHWGGLEQRGILIFQKGATEDLGLWLMEVPSGIEGGFTYNADLYTAATAAAFRERFLELVHRFAGHPALTLGELISPAGSASAAYLQRLAPDAGVPPAPGAAPASQAAAPKAESRALRLTDAEFAMAEIWASLLQIDVESIGVESRFFELGGNSLLAMELVAQAEQRYACALKLNDLVADPTIRELVGQLRTTAAVAPAPSAVPASPRDTAALLRAGGAKPPVFLVHDGDGQTLLYRNLAQRLSAGHAVYGLQPLSGPGAAMMHTRLADMARYHIGKIRQIQPHGPYLLGGLCAGGVIAYEIARQLQKEGEPIAMLGLIDAADVGVAVRTGHRAGQRLKSFSSAFQGDRSEPAWQRWAKALRKAAGKIANLVIYTVSSRLEERRLHRKLRILRDHLDRGAVPPPAVHDLSVAQIYQFALTDDTDRELFRGDVALFRASMADGTPENEPYIDRFADPLLGWQRRISGVVHCFDVPGGHFSMLQEPHAEVTARHMQSVIDRALDARPSASGA